MTHDNKRERHDRIRDPVVLLVRMEKSLKDQLRQAGEDTLVSMSALIRRLIMDYLDRRSR